MTISHLKQKLVASLIASVVAALPFQSTPRPAHQPERLCARPHPGRSAAGLSDDEFDKILKVHGGKRRKLGQSNVHIVDLPGNASETAVAERLSHNPNLKFAELDRRVKTSMAVNDPYLGSEWHMAKIGAANAWDISQGAGVTIAILDSGVDTSPP